MGPSLQLLAPDLDNNHSSSWFASNGIPFSPGSTNGGNSNGESHILPEHSVHVYPNPVGEVLFLEINEEPGARVEVGIFTLSGTRANSLLFNSVGGFQTVSWQHGIEQPGAYIIQVKVQHAGYQQKESHLLIFTGTR